MHDAGGSGLGELRGAMSWCGELRRRPGVVSDRSDLRRLLQGLLQLHRLLARQRGAATGAEPARRAGRGGDDLRCKWGEGAATFAASGRGEGVATGEHAALTHYGAHISPPRPPNTASRLQPSTIATRIPLLFLINFRRSLDDPDLPPHRDIGLRPVIPPRLRAWRKVRWWGSAKVICRRRGGARVFTGEVRRNTLVSHFDPTRNNDCQN